MEINEKKKSFIMKKENFFFGAEILKGYCPVCIVTERLGSRCAQGRRRACWGAREACVGRADGS